MKNQIIFIRGAEAFDNREQYYDYLENRPYNPFDHRKSWRDWVAWALSDEYDMMAPDMPNKQYADYRSWKIWFEKLFPYLNESKLIMVGSSLGSLFLAKYLSENKFPKRINQLHLVASVFDNDGLDGETVGDFILDPEKLPALEKQVDHICIYNSRDDKLVPFVHGEKYHSHLPKSELFIFENRGHFDQPAIPELLENINRLNKE